MKKLVFICFCLLLAWPQKTFANAASAYKKFFEVNMQEQYPSMEELQAKFPIESNYDKGYDYGWNIGLRFKDTFRRIIKSYGMSEKRLKTPTEDALLEAIKMMPPSSYPYIGPFLHTIPGMSPKILNYPGIKETKNKFPERIAPELQHIEDLEFLSPNLYYVLMPEAWQTYNGTAEFPTKRGRAPFAPYDPKFFEKLNQFADMRAYIPKTKAKLAHKPDPMQRRTIHPTASSPLTIPDSQAVADTFKDIQQLNKDFALFVKVMQASRLLDSLENAQGKSLPVSSLVKDLANPCRRLVQKFRLAGEERKLSAIAAKQGMSLEEWGYTCDKTVKARRAANMSRETAAAISVYRRGIMDSASALLSPATAEANYALMQTVIEMYDAPLSDVAAVVKNRRNLDDSFTNINNVLIFHPISGID